MVCSIKLIRLKLRSCYPICQKVNQNLQNITEKIQKHTKEYRNQNIYAHTVTKKSEVHLMPIAGILTIASYPHFKRKCEARCSFPLRNLITKVSFIPV
jgi:hypothetical protein